MPFEPSVLAEDGSGEQFADLDGFLRRVEGRAYRIALVSVRDCDDALDIVQDSMMRFATRYASRPEPEWRPLFYRILKNRIRDWARRRAVRQRVMSLFSSRQNDGSDPIESAPGPATDDPRRKAESDQAMQALEAALQELSARQREAFVLRSFESFDVAETAVAMGISEGSVKTHFSRAVTRLRESLGEEWS